MRSTFIKHILSALEQQSAQLKRSFTHPGEISTSYFSVDNLLPAEMAQSISNAMPPVDEMRLRKTLRETKYTSRNFDQFSPIIRDIEYALQSQKVVDTISDITGLDQLVPDASFYAGGLSAMCHDHFLHPHLDNSHDADRKLYRRLNLLYYASPGWQQEDGGNLELWDERVQNRVEIPCQFNRLVVMETNRTSWHSVNRVRQNGVRYCISNYFFSPKSSEGFDYFHVTSFKARPESGLLHRAYFRFDNAMRNGIRKIVRKGVGQVDVYTKSRQ